MSTVQARYPARGASTSFVVWGLGAGAAAGFLAPSVALAATMSGSPSEWVDFLSAVAALGGIPGMLIGAAAGALIGGLALTMFRATRELSPLRRRATSVGIGAGLMTGVLFAAADFAILGGLFNVDIGHWPIHILEVLGALGAGFGYAWLTRRMASGESHAPRPESATLGE